MINKKRGVGANYIIKLEANLPSERKKIDANTNILHQLSTLIYTILLIFY